MSSARIALQPAFVLHTWPYGDTSLIIEVFTAQHGRMGLVARGARGPKSKTRAILQALQPLLLSWRASGELGTLTGVEAQGMPTALVGDALFCAWYVNELLMKLTTRFDPHPVLFAAYAATLPRLALDADAGLRAFERQLLAELGYGLVLPDDLDPARRYRYLPEQGPVASRELEGSIAGDSLIALRDDTFSTPGQRSEARQLLRQAIARQLAGRPLATAQLLRELREFSSRDLSG